MKSFVLALFLFLIATTAQAGGPFYTDIVNNSGVPPRWKGGVVYWKVDAGDMSKTIKHADAMADNGWVKPLFDKWEKVILNLANGTPVATAGVQFIYQGDVGEDITALNLSKYLKCGPDWQPLPYAVVVFDSDGTIMQYLRDECGLAIDPDKTIGLGNPSVDGNGEWIQAGIIIFNGRMKDGVDTKTDPTNNEITDKMFKAAVLHEVGHLLNLDHGQANKEAEENCWKDPNNCGAAQSDLIPTMYPSSLSDAQYSLHHDDKIALSLLYPTTDFLQQFCVAHGQLKDVKGHGVPGINVVARDLNNPNVDVRAMVSGVLYFQGIKPDGHSDGQYYLYGLLPNEEYQINYESLSQGKNGQFVGPSGFEPLDHPPQIDGGAIPGKNGTATVKCDTGGQTIEMPDVTLQLEVKSTGIVPVTPGTAVTPPAPKKLTCSLTVDAPMNFSWLFMVLPSLILLLIQCIPTFHAPKPRIHPHS